MTGFFEVVLIAMGAQLAVLPGEKVQFLIAGFSTKYNPIVVVTAAGTAFAGWTAVEILFGNAIKGVLPPVVLDIVTASLLLVFAILLWRSTPDAQDQPLDTDGGVTPATEHELPVVGTLPDYLGGFLPIFGVMAAGEFGDKTQLVTIGLAVQYGAHPGIWVGEMLAIIPVSAANAYFFHRFSNRFDARKAHLFGAIVFAFFAADMFLQITTGFSVWESIVNGIGTVIGGVF